MPGMRCEAPGPALLSSGDPSFLSPVVSPASERVGSHTLTSRIPLSLRDSREESVGGVGVRPANVPRGNSQRGGGGGGFIADDDAIAEQQMELETTPSFIGERKREREREEGE